MNKDVKMYEELLELLEKRYKEGEIDKESYEELKARYDDKLRNAKEAEKEAETTPSIISVAGSHSISNDAMSFAGATKITGGKVLRDIRIAGAGKIDGDIECKNMKVSGALKATGSVVAHGYVKCSGSFKSNGKLEAKENISCSGSASVDGTVDTEGELDTSGSFSASDNVFAQKAISASGSFEVKGTVSSQGKIFLGGKTRVDGNVLGQDVELSGKRSAFEKMFRKRELSEVSGSIFAHNVIEVEDVHVENNVKGKLVKLGPNVTVAGTVYYVDDLLLTDDVKLDNKPVKISIEELKL